VIAWREAKPSVSAILVMQASSLLSRAYCMRPSTNGASSWLAASSAHVPGQSLLDSSTNTSFFFFVGGGGPTAKLTLCNALHSLGQSIQVVAITIYFLLATAFYVFLAPFLWIGALESAAFALYSPLVSHFFLPSFFFFFWITEHC
jgi:hypothetical protein